MQPQNSLSPNPNYDFILNGQNRPKNRFGLTPFHLKGDVSRLSLISLAVVVLILFSIVLFGGNGTNTQPYIDLVAQAQEINRVSQLVSAQQSTDPTVLGWAATTQATMSSQEQQLAEYLKSLHKNIDPAHVTLYLNKSTDTNLQSASQNGNLDSYFSNYLKTNLANYQTSLSNQYKVATPKARALITTAYNSNKILLNSL